MLDVHPPHEPVHGWRDFLLHIATITIGLLIALSLEAMVEALHHRHIVHGARENIREEVRQNREILAKDREHLETNRARLTRQITELNAYAANRKQAAPAIEFPWAWNAPASSAWETARSTGALALMPYQEVQTYAQIYGQQVYVDEQATTYIRHQTDAGTPLRIHGDVADLTPAQVEQLTTSCAVSLNDIDYTENLMRGLEQGYEHLLSAKE